VDAGAAHKIRRGGTDQLQRHGQPLAVGRRRPRRSRALREARPTAPRGSHGRHVRDHRERDHVRSPAHARRSAAAHRERRVRRLDDFGTGYSSFAYLQRLPITCIKIDRSFVRELQERVDSRVIVGAPIHLGHDLGLHVVADGVESQEQRALLEMLGCPSAQGYLFARALTLDDLMARLRTESAAHLGKNSTGSRSACARSSP
jgi:hypothetical protein